jgi:hypothetical protein
MKGTTPYIVALGIMIVILLGCYFVKIREGFEQTIVPAANTDPVAFCSSKGQVAVVAYKTDTSSTAKPTFKACYNEGVTGVDAALFTTNAKIVVTAPRNRAVKLWTGSGGSGSVLSSLPNLDPKAETTTELTLVDSSFRSIQVDPMEVTTSSTAPAGVDALKNLEPETGKETFSTSFPNCPGKVVVTRAATQTIYGCYGVGLTNVNAGFMATNRFTNVRVPVGGSATLYSGVNGTGNVVANVPVSGKADPNVVEKANLKFKSIRVTLPGQSAAAAVTTPATPATPAAPAAPTPPPNPSPPPTDLNAAQILAIQNLKPTAALCSQTFSQITNQVPLSNRTSYVPSVQTCNMNYPVLPTRGVASQPLLSFL